MIQPGLRFPVHCGSMFVAAFITSSCLLLSVSADVIPLPHTVQVQRDDFLSGTWYNQLGSRMTLNSTGDGTIFGTFKSGVERRVGASGGTQVLRGHVGVGPPTTLGFTVTFNDGASTASWSGQYHMCGGKEVLLMTWVLTTQTDTCHEHWSATNIGQDTFTRTLPVSRRRHWKKSRGGSKHRNGRKLSMKD